jgi:hypothetical protein
MFPVRYEMNYLYYLQVQSLKVQEHCFAPATVLVDRVLEQTVLH